MWEASHYSPEPIIANVNRWGPDEDGEDDEDSEDGWDVEDGEGVEEDDDVKDGQGVGDGDAEDEKQTPLLKWDDANLIATSFTTSYQQDGIVKRWKRELNLTYWVRGKTWSVHSVWSWLYWVVADRPAIA